MLSSCAAQWTSRPGGSKRQRQRHSGSRALARAAARRAAPGRAALLGRAASGPRLARAGAPTLRRAISLLVGSTRRMAASYQDMAANSMATGLPSRSSTSRRNLNGLLELLLGPQLGFVDLLLGRLLLGLLLLRLQRGSGGPARLRLAVFGGSGVGAPAAAAAVAAKVAAIRALPLAAAPRLGPPGRQLRRRRRGHERGRQWRSKRGGQRPRRRPRPRPPGGQKPCSSCQRGGGVAA